MVHVCEKQHSTVDHLQREIAFLDKAYPDIDIELVIEKGRFSPALVAELADRWAIPPNFMFIGCPGDGLTHNLAELGGVREIV